LKNKFGYTLLFAKFYLQKGLVFNLLVILVVTVACRSEGRDKSVSRDLSELKQDTIKFSRPDAKEQPEKIRDWVSVLQELDRSPLWHTRVVGDMKYIYVGWGVKPTGGYHLEVTNIHKTSDELIVTTKFQAPSPDEIVIQMMTRPFDLIVIENSDAQIRIEPEGEDAPRLFLTINGIEEIKPVVAGSRSIKLFEPEPGKNVVPGFRVSGIASVFEATVNYRILNREGEIVHESFTTAYDGMNWGYFSFEPEFKLESEGDSDFYLELFNIDAQDGSEINKFRIPLELNSR
jgi:hypothetical protein